jgi:hypothetical protein
MDFFKNAEPRLRAYVIFPGDVFKGKEIEIYAGVYTGATPITGGMFNGYTYSTAREIYDKLSIYTNEEAKTLYLSSNTGSNQEHVTYVSSVNDDLDTITITASGENGPFYAAGECCLTGLYVRKYLNPDPAAVIGEGKSAQPFILMRYGEVLLNAAEAAVELALAGVASPDDGSDYATVATQAIKDIRERAGAKQLTGSITLDEGGRDTVRKERRKELAFEYKSVWDIRRWRVQHDEGRGGFWGEPRDKSKFSSNTDYRFRGLYPFFSTQAEKWFFDARFQAYSLKTMGYSTIDYYFAIPGDEVTKSAVIDQQPNR